MSVDQIVHVEDYNIDIGLYYGPLLRGQPHGEGRVACYNGDGYEGQWKEGKFHGQGRYTFANGNVYEGQWVENKRTGYGVFTWPSGDRYEGAFVNSRRHGQGTYRYADGNVFEGAWENGKRNGLGKLTYADGTIKTGRWENSEYIPGSGSIVAPAPTTEYKRVNYTKGYYQGPLVNGKRHGWGKFVWNNGESYRGDFVNGELTGQGVYHFKGGNVYKGEFLEGKMHGQGVMCRPDGSQRQGRWENNVYISGSGKETRPVLGRWEDYLELYDWWDMGLGDTAFYNERFRLLRARGNAQEVVRRKLGGEDLSGVSRGDAIVCRFLLDRFVPKNADRELLARCFYLTEDICKAAGVVAMTLEGNQLRRYRGQALSPSDGLAMEIMAAHYLRKAIRQIQEKRTYRWDYWAAENLKKARKYWRQAGFAAARWERDTMESQILRMEAFLASC